MTWLAGYEHQRVSGGLDVLAGGDKFVVHTTEGTGFQSQIDVWRRNPQSGAPHFLLKGSRVAQLIPLDRNAFTLENKTGGAETNKCGHVIQVEVVGFANDARTREEYETLGRLVADCMAAGLNLDLGLCPRFWDDSERAWLATYTSGVRLSAHDWTWLNTILGHQHAPENAHWDPGGLDVHRVCEIARRYLGQPIEHGDALDMAEPKDIIDPIANKLDLMHAKLATEIRQWINEARVQDQQAQENIQGNLAGVIRGEAGDTRAQVVAGFDRVLRDIADDAGHLPAGVAVAELVALVAGQLTVAPKTP